ncbi:hypothetical protein BKI52_05650 [marine bacterium AO1-C]|nr:hypothetical protein BKI52_05650 [marine bacterium AO1-C]
MINYETSDGLSTNLTKAVIKDKQGYIWIATDDGIVRFDGKHFRKIKEGLASEYNKSIYLTKKGEVVVCNDLGILKVQYSSGDSILIKTIITGNTDANDPKKVHYPKGLFEDQQENWWISEPTSILRRSISGHLNRYTFPKKYHTNSFVRSFSFIEVGQTLWAISYTGHLLRFNPQSNAFVEMPLPDNIDLNGASALLAIDSKTFWVGYSGGVAEIKLSGHAIDSAKLLFKVANVSSLTTVNNRAYVGTWSKQLYQANLGVQPNTLQIIGGFSSNVVNDIYPDNENNIWVSTDEGLVLMVENEFQLVKLADYEAYTEGINKTRDGRILVCDGAKVYTLEKQGTGFSKKIVFENALGLTSVGYAAQRYFTGNREGILTYIEEKETPTLKTKIGKIDLGEYGKTIIAMTTDVQDNLWLCQYDQKAGVVKLDKNLHPTYYNESRGVRSLVTVVKENAQKTLFCGARGKNTYLYQYDSVQERFINISLPLNIASENQFAVNDMVFDNQGKLWLATTHGLFCKNGNQIKRVSLGEKFTRENIKSVLIDQNGIIWLGTHIGVLKLANTQVILFNKTNGLSTETIAYRGLQQLSDNLLFVGTANGLNVISTNQQSTQTTATPVLLKLNNSTEQLVWHNTDLELPYNTSLRGRFMSFTYPNDAVVYQYRLKGLTDHWSEATTQNQFMVPRIPHGKYLLEVRAKQQGNYTWSESLTLPFTVKKAWYFTPLALVGYGFVLLILLWMVVYVNTLRLKKQKAKLAALVQERTVELEQKNDHLQAAYNLVNAQKQEITTRNEELHQQQEELASQRDFIVEKNKVLERQSRQIKLSISAALTIQQAILPYDKKMETLLRQYFVLYRPKDVVSGDFYWLNEIDGKMIFVVADCTGHGVPGAFMTLIGNTLLDKIVRVWKITDPAEILERLHKEVRTVLKQRYTGNSSGMDALVMNITKGVLPGERKMVFASAKMPFFYIKKGSKEIKRMRGDRRHIGGVQKNKEPFINQEVSFLPGDMIYLGSDGFIDQCNENRKSFGSKRLNDLLTRIVNYPLPKQKEYMETALDEYRQGTPQRDDILMIGVKV